MTDPTDPTDPPEPAESLVRKLDFAMILLRIARCWMPPDFGVTIIVHKGELISAGTMETAVVTTLPSRAQQRIALLEALWQSGLADVADGTEDPVDLALRDMNELAELAGKRSKSS